MCLVPSLTRLLLTVTLVLLHASTAQNGSSTNWQLESSLKYDALCLLNVLSLTQEDGSRSHGAPITPLPTGVRLDPVGDFVDLGSMPLGMALAPGGKQVVAVMSGWRERGIQVIDLESLKVTQSLTQDAAFLGVAFSQDGKHLYVSGGNEDLIYAYSWSNGAATLEKKIVLGEKKGDRTGSRYPAGIAASRKGNLLYVAENVGDSLAVVAPDSGHVLQRFSTDHYPYAVEASADGRVYLSAWGGDTVSMFRALDDGTLSLNGRVLVGPRPSALVSSRDGTRMWEQLVCEHVHSVSLGAPTGVPPSQCKDFTNPQTGHCRKDDDCAGWFPA